MIEPHHINPFPGLRPFEFNESHLFFGRDDQSEELLRKLSHGRFTAVVGPSSSGKSSLVRAGLLPILVGGMMFSAGAKWRFAILRPGSNPISNLAETLSATEMFGEAHAEDAIIQATFAEATLRRSSRGIVELVNQSRVPSDENLLIVVDQFEELFRFIHFGTEGGKDEAAAFVKLLLKATEESSRSIYVVLTMRSDFLGDCAQFWDLPEALNAGQYLVPRLTRDQCRQAITAPIAVSGAEISWPLVNQLLNDIGDNPDHLPLLQHALMRTWDYWVANSQNREPIDFIHYKAVGGMAEALSRHADEAYYELPDHLKPMAEKLFKCLTEMGIGNREARRPSTIREICAAAEASEEEMITVIETFRGAGRSFLMPPSYVSLSEDSLIDISHESLIRNWKRLKRWVKEESESARIYQRLAETSELYNEGAAGLWRDPDLNIALAWRQQVKPNPAWAKRYNPNFESAMSFLDKSETNYQAERLDIERSRRKQLQMTRLFVVALSVIALFAVALALYANQQRRQALIQQKLFQEQKIIAEQKAREAEEARKQAERLSKAKDQELQSNKPAR